MSIDHKQKGINQLDDRLIEGLSNGVDKSANYLKNRMVMKVESNIPPALKPATIKRKGSSVALFDTGEMYSQIDADIQRVSAKVGVIGSKAEIATHHEFGAPAAGIPERSFVRSTFNEEKGKMEKIVAGEIKKEI
jgi:phage gpG-like protein